MSGNRGVFRGTLKTSVKKTLFSSTTIIFSSYLIRSFYELFLELWLSLWCSNSHCVLSPTDFHVSFIFSLHVLSLSRFMENSLDLSSTFCLSSKFCFIYSIFQKFIEISCFIHFLILLTLIFFSTLIYGLKRGESYYMFFHNPIS